MKVCYFVALCYIFQLGDDNIGYKKSQKIRRKKQSEKNCTLSTADSWYSRYFILGSGSKPTVDGGRSVIKSSSSTKWQQSPTRMVKFIQRMHEI